MPMFTDRTPSSPDEVHDRQVTESYVKALFRDCSKDELVGMLCLMHRILCANKPRDLDQIARTLSALPRVAQNFTAASDSNPRSSQEIPALRAQEAQAAGLTIYWLSVLSQAKAKIEAPHGRRAKSIATPPTLSPRERTVLIWMKEGKTNWEIAKILGLSERTVRFHVGSIFEKLGVTSRTQAVARALGSGLIAS